MISQILHYEVNAGNLAIQERSTLQ